MSCCDACCDCDCCLGEIKDTYPNLSESTQILPPTINSQYATNITKNIPDTVSSKNNFLISFGDITYEPILELSTLEGLKENYPIEVKKISFGDFHSLMIIKYIDSNHSEQTLLYGYGSNFNGELGIDYHLKDKKKNFYRKWTKVDVEKALNKANKVSFFFQVDLSFLIDDILVGDKFSIMTVKYKSDNKTIGIYRFELRKDAKFTVLENELNTQESNLGKEKTEVEKTNKADGVGTITRENFNEGGENGGIKQVGVFGDRILILTGNNSLFIKGTMYDMANATNYTLYKKFKENIRSLHLGINSCLLLGESNTIYAYGHNDYCEFGESTEKIKEILKEQKTKSKNFNLVQNENEINTNTNNSKNIIEEDNNNGYENKSIDSYENKFFQNLGKKIIKMSTGARHSLILLEGGEVYCFGDNSDGQCCGLEKIVSTSSKVQFNDEDDDEDELNNQNNQKNQNPNREVIIDIMAGFNHSIAKGKDGKIYVWGDSAWGKLGFKETRTDQYEPIEVSDMKIRNVIRFFAGPKQSAFYISGGITY